MRIQVNGDLQNFAGDKLSILEVIQKNNVKQPEMVTVQVNGEFADRETFGESTLVDGDEVDFVYFMGGGSF